MLIKNEATHELILTMGQTVVLGSGSAMLE